MYRETSDPTTVWVHFSLIKSGGRRSRLWNQSVKVVQKQNLSSYNPILEMMHNATVDFLYTNI